MHSWTVRNRLISITILLAGFRIVVWKSRYCLIEVAGYSMYPIYAPGDLLLSRRLDRRQVPEIGQDVIFASAAALGQLGRLSSPRLIKRVVKTEGGAGVARFFVQGTMAGSLDSRTFGTIALDDIHSVALRVVRRSGNL
jgi:signal peptidase I